MCYFACLESPFYLRFLLIFSFPRSSSQLEVSNVVLLGSPSLYLILRDAFQCRPLSPAVSCCPLLSPEECGFPQFTVSYLSMLFLSLFVSILSGSYLSCAENLSWQTPAKLPVSIRLASYLLFHAGCANCSWSCFLRYCFFQCFLLHRLSRNFLDPLFIALGIFSDKLRLNCWSQLL